MYKRFQVLDLFRANQIEEENCDWIEFNADQSKTHPPVVGKNAKVKIKLKCGSEHLAYFSVNLPMSGKNPYFWHAKSHKSFLDEEVTHWKPLKKPK